MLKQLFSILALTGYYYCHLNLFLSNLINAAFASGGAKNPSCDPGWMDAHLEGLGCLLFGNEPGTFEDANRFCYNNSAPLVEILTEGQMDYMVMELQLLETFLGPRFYCGGGTDWNSEGRWYWANSLIPIEDFVWTKGEPNEGIKANYFAFWPTSGYYGADEGRGEDKYYPICQKFT